MVSPSFQSMSRNVKCYCWTVRDPIAYNAVGCDCTPEKVVDCPNRGTGGDSEQLCPRCCRGIIVDVQCGGAKRRHRSTPEPPWAILANNDSSGVRRLCEG